VSGGRRRVGASTQAFAASAVDMGGLQLAALDLVQHGLSGDAEGFGGLVEAEPALGCLGLDAVTQGLVDADAPGCARCDLFGGDRPAKHSSTSRAHCRHRHHEQRLLNLIVPIAVGAT